MGAPTVAASTAYGCSLGCLRLQGSHLREVEALVRGDDPLQEGLLLGGGHDLMPAIRESLVARELLTQQLDEGR